MALATGILLIFVSISSTVCLEPNLNYTYPTTKYFTQKLDHFNPTIDDTYSQRYLISTQYWKAGGPIFFYAGNEGVITAFVNNTGFMWDIAPQFSAMVVFAEHRYYGESKPYPDLKPKPKNVHKFGQFTVEQALADYAKLISHLKMTIHGAAGSPVVAFGGSYGGMLAAWLRRKYPHIVIGALAASAPVRYFPGQVDCEEYNEIVTNDFQDGPHGLACINNIKNSWAEVDKLAKTAKGRSTLKQIFRLCDPLTNSEKLDDWLSDAWTSLAMLNYPYPTSFFSSLPAWPVKETCKLLSKPDLKGTTLLDAIRDAASVYYNYTGQVECFSLDDDDSHGLSNSLWNFQTCTQMVMPFCANPAKDMFKPKVWTFAEYTKDCQQNFGTTPRSDWAILQFGGDDWSEQSNIIFSNGGLDPWRAGGILKSASSKILTLFIENAAHHLDLRHVNPTDTSVLKIARQEEIETISSWLMQYKV